jgi:hypothetical protein
MRALLGKPKLVGVPDGSLVTHREFMAALGAAPRDYCPSILGAHAYQEPVRLCPFTVVRLKCAFWHLILYPGKVPETKKLTFSIGVRGKECQTLRCKDLCW